MNYDSSISLKVNLSRVLDELIMDGSDLENIVQFLKSHENDIPDIYKHSALVYDLYDLIAHPMRFDPFLYKHVNDLPMVEFCFAVNSLATLWIEDDIHFGATRELQRRFHGTVELVRFIRAGWNGAYKDGEFLALKEGKCDLVEYLNKQDERSLRDFLLHSYNAKSAFQAKTFIRLNPGTQFMLLNNIDRFCSKAGGIYSSRRVSSEDVSRQCYVVADLVRSLMRQLLALNNTELFNWVVDVLGFGKGDSDYIYRFDRLENNLRDSILSTIPKSLVERLPNTDEIYRVPADPEGRATFEEIVFDMNLIENQFETYDLFLYIYLLDNFLLKGMRDNLDLMEFFNLPFDWDELKKLKPEFKLKAYGVND